MSNFAFLAAEFPAVHEAAVEAERQASVSAAAFFAGKTVEIAVAKNQERCGLNQSFRKIRITLDPFPKSPIKSSPSCPTEGRWPSSLTRGGMRWTRQRQA